MREELSRIIPEFELIEDEGLREKTIRVWAEAMREASWKIEDLEKMPFTLLLKNVSVNIIEHTRAVTLCSLEIAGILIKAYGEKISIHKDFLLSGALLHDVGKLFEYRKEEQRFLKSRSGELLRHPISGAAFAFKFGLPQEVIHIIAAHSKEGDGMRRTLEAVIVNHADFINFDIFKD